MFSSIAFCLLTLAQVRPPNQFSIVFGGDLMFENIHPQQEPLHALNNLFQNASLACANLESPLTNYRGVTARKSLRELKERKQYILGGSPTFIPQIASSGIRFVTLANNHAMDHLAGGLSQEMDQLSANKVVFAGAGLNRDSASQMKVFQVSGLKIGFISALAFVSHAALWKCTPATTTSAGIMTLDLNGNVNAPWLKTWIRECKHQVDFLVFGLHWGVERREKPIPYQVSLAHALIDDGVDLIYGCHPHVLEGAVLYHGKVILYSMGNLVSPTPASGGLIRLTFSGRDLQSAKFIAFSVLGGRIKIIQRDQAQKRNMDRLDRIAAVRGKDIPLWF